MKFTRDNLDGKARHPHAIHSKATLVLDAFKARCKVNCTPVKFTFPPRFSGAKNNKVYTLYTHQFCAIKQDKKVLTFKDDFRFLFGACDTTCGTFFGA